MTSVRERLDQVFDRLGQLEAEPLALLLTEWDYQEFAHEMQVSAGPLEYRGVQARKGEIGGTSYIQARKPDGEVTNFGV